MNEAIVLTPAEEQELWERLRWADFVKQGWPEEGDLLEQEALDDIYQRATSRADGVWVQILEP